MIYCNNLDFACRGDGEEVLPFINNDPSNLPNLVWRRNGDIILNPRQFVDINKYPMPALDLLRPDTNPAAPIGIFSSKRRIAQIIATRGCYYPCTFCGVPSISGKNIRLRKYEHILQEIEILISRYNIEEIHFIDDNITASPRNWFINLLEELIHSKFPARYAFPSGIRIDSLDDQICELMKRAGVYSFAVGIESANQKTIDLLGKKLNINIVQKKLEIISKYKFDVQGCFILGHPSESLMDMIRTIGFACKSRITRAGFFVFTPFPGSKEWNSIRSRYPMKEWQNIISKFNIYSHPPEIERRISNFTLKCIQLYAYLRFYLRPKILIKILSRIKTFFQIKLF